MKKLLLSLASSLLALALVEGVFRLVPEKLGELCEGGHVLVFEDAFSLDQEMILTTLPVLDDGKLVGIISFSQQNSG